MQPQVGFFYDGTGCETAQCYKHLHDKVCAGEQKLCDAIEEKINRDIYETQAKKMYPELVKLAELATGAACTDEELTCKEVKLENTIKLIKNGLKIIKNIVENADKSVAPNELLSLFAIEEYFSQ